ncbi:DUF6397 family protein [Streptomyces zaomyceticus]|uniref:DUF6397 family protein n=1 Tax=Streptomyces zaomyceticus TaxID=68286 RepID=UPI0016782F08|nr:DUF6397 family protein [Streptomyces zaomyceticus]
MTVDQGARTVSPVRAAQELELGRDEFRLAVQLGLVRTVPAGERGRRRIERCELDRLKAAPDFPVGLRERVRAVGTGEAAALLEITPERFTKLVRTGHLSPVRFSLNRYRAVVWTYLAEEVAEFGPTCPGLLTGRLPLELRERLAAHEDLRPRNWRARRLGMLLRATDDPWARTAAIASLLDPVHVAEVVDDPYERAHLDRLHPPAPPGMPVQTAARDIAERLTRADDPDEILWHRVSLVMSLDEARAMEPAPYPGEKHAITSRAEPSVATRAGFGGRVPLPRPPVLTTAPVPSVPLAPLGPFERSARPASVVPLGAGVGRRRLEVQAPPPMPPAPPSVPAAPVTPWVPATGQAPATPPVSVHPSVPVTPSAPAGRPVADGRRPGRRGRTSLLDRLRRGRGAGEGRVGGRSGGRKRPAAWP